MGGSRSCVHPRLESPAGSADPAANCSRRPARTERVLIRAWLLLCVAAATARAQLPGSVAADRARLLEITGGKDTVERSNLPLGALLPIRRSDALFFGSDLFVVRPDIRTTYNSQIPFSLNDGPMWAGRGWSFTASAGLGAERRVRGVTTRLVVAPAVLYGQNRPFSASPVGHPERSAFASPFHLPGAPALDLPFRFGDLHILRVDPGRSGITVSTGAVTAGVTAENEVWGPGIRNALVMSANAPGVPRVFLSTSRPIRTRAGSIEAKLIGGTLTESLYFDTVSTNNFRSLSGARVQLRPAFDSTLTIGFARVVYAPIESPIVGPIAHALDVVTRWEHVRLGSDTVAGGRMRQRADQITSLFARWIFPEAGFEMYGEWARMDLPRALTELLVAGHHSAGYTFGVQWAQPRRLAHVLRLQAEFTYLEQSRVFEDRPLPDFYAGQVSPQGYTNRGQVIGAAIGPGGSSQWLALDYLAPLWQSGVYLGRIRWENDALYRQPVPNFFKHDVTVFGGLRGGVRTAATDLAIDATYGYRFNYLFQFGGANPGGFRTVDIRNFTLGLSLTPR